MLQHAAADQFVLVGVALLRGFQFTRPERAPFLGRVRPSLGCPYRFRRGALRQDRRESVALVGRHPPLPPFGQ